MFEIYTIEIIAKYPKGQWVKIDLSWIVYICYELLLMPESIVSSDKTQISLSKNIPGWVQSLCLYKCHLWLFIIGSAIKCQVVLL